MRWDSYDTVNDTSCQDDHLHDLSSARSSQSEFLFFQLSARFVPSEIKQFNRENL